MTVKTLTGPSIQAALSRARTELGDDVVLMESTPATAESPARIVVGVDPAAASRSSRGRVPKPPGDGPLPVPEAPSSTAPASSKPANASNKQSSAAPNAPAPGTSGSSAPRTDDDASPQDDEGTAPTGTRSDFGQMLKEQRETGRGRIFPVSDRSPDPASSGASSSDDAPALFPDDASAHGPSSSSASPQGAPSSSFSDGANRAPSAPSRWAQHPLYDVLREKGLRPDTVTALFNDLSERGVDLTGNSMEDLRWAFAQVLCRRLAVAAPECGRPPLALVGPGGAGKTSLLLKLATHGTLLGSGTPVVVHLQPNADRRPAYQNPTALYQRHGIPTQNVRTEDDMARALNRARDFDHVLIDTPPLPLPLDAARPTLRRYARLLRPLRAFRVHFVLSATHAYDSLDGDTLPHLPLRPEALAITHLDEAATWGRVAEWLLRLDPPVHFVSEGRQVPTDARAFSLRWFVDDVMDL